MYLSKLNFPIVFERSRSKVKVTRGQKVKNFDRPYLKNYWADSLQTKTKNVQLVKGFPPICLVLKFHFRSKSLPEVQCQINIFGHNSKTIGRINLKQKRFDSSRRAAQKCCTYFSSYGATFWRYSQFCVFWTLVILGLCAFHATYLGGDE